MAGVWKIAINGKVDPRRFKNYAEFDNVIRQEIKSGIIPPGADIKVSKSDENEAAEPDTAAVTAGNRSWQPYVYTYKRELKHNQVMTGAMLMGMVFGWYLHKIVLAIVAGAPHVQ